MSLRPLPRVEAGYLLREVDRELIPLLRGLKAAEWRLPAVGEWAVRDVAAHLLDGALRRLSMQRDDYRAPGSARAPESRDRLVEFLNELNASWVKAAARLSPRVLTDLLEQVSPQLADLLQSLDPEGEAKFPVAWAGEAGSKNWMDVAREFTERWHHQQQIREAVGAPWLDDWRFLEPLLNTFIRALPRTYAAIQAPPGTLLLVGISERTELAWALERRPEGWKLGQPREDRQPRASVWLPAEIAWRLFTKGITNRTAEQAATVDGDVPLARGLFATRAVMA